MSVVLEMFDPEEADYLHTSKAGVVAASVKVTKVKSPYVFKNEMVRFQFLEYVMRCAVKKYYESGKCDSELEAVQMLIDNHFVAKIGDQFD